MENDEWQERRTEPVNERNTMKNSRKTNVKSNTSDIEAKEKKEQQEQEKILAAKYLIELIRSVLEERKPQPKPEQISMKCLFLTAKKHNLACMAYDAAKQIAGKEDKEVMEAWQNYSRTCMIMSAVQGKEGERLLERFSDNQVRVLPLKGWIMRRFYPKPEYRQMTDLDFLIDEENRKAVKQIMTDQERYQFQHIENENTVDSYQKDPWMHVEIHNDMISYNKERYENIWERCEQKNAVYSMNWDDYYMFMLDHLEKHFTLAGCGIRFLLDVYIFLQAKGKELHRDKLKKEFRKRNQEAFFKQVEETANAWFGEAYHVGDTELERVILLSGTFGTNSQKFENRQEKIQKKYKNKKVAKAMYFLTRTFPEYSYMCNIYPFLYKAPVLMPVMWIVRLICAPVTKMDRIRKEVGFWRKMGKKE